jgi:hypothetical protein
MPKQITKGEENEKNFYIFNNGGFRNGKFARREGVQEKRRALGRSEQYDCGRKLGGQVAGVL